MKTPPALATDVILHAFDWPYALVRERARQIYQAGYKSVLISPPNKSLISETGTDWWQRYQPQDYRVIDNQLGNTTDFKNMIKALSAMNINVYADVVLNHMANESSIRNDLQYPSKNDLIQYREQSDYYQEQLLYGDLRRPLFVDRDFEDAFRIEDGDWHDIWRVQHGRINVGQEDPGLPTLRVHEHVIEQQRAYLKALKSLGVRGFRIDAAKHMTLKHIQEVWNKEICQDVHVFGEIITYGGAGTPEYDLFLQPFLAETRFGAYDFPLFQTLYNALDTRGSLESLIDPYGLGQALSGMRAITFAITHDMPNNDMFANLVMTETREWLAYCYLLGRDGGVPLVYTDLDTSGIKNKADKPRWVDAWKDENTIAAIDFHNRMHGKPMEILQASKDLLVFTRGHDGMVIINKSKREQVVELETNQEWMDLLTLDSFKPIGGRYQIIIDSESGMMLVAIE